MKLHYRSYGAGQDILILHGLFGMLDNWQTFARDLASTYNVWTVDLRNHGRSPHSDEFSYSVMAGDIIEFIHDHQLQSPVLIGHSLGGKVAMQTALTIPEMISRLMVVDIAPKTYPPGHDEIIDALLSTNPASFNSRNGVADALTGKLNDQGVVLFLMKNLARAEDGSLYWRMNLPVLSARYDTTIGTLDATGQYTGPTLFVRGGRSQYVLDSDLPAIKTLFPDARLETVANAGHWVHADALHELLTLTREFLS